jgi:hypothetical protein
MMGTEQQLMNLVALNGPQIVGIFASSNFQRYGSGVFVDTPDKCFTGNCDQVNHAVVVFGYGTDPTLGDYWLIRNSWVSFGWIILNLKLIFLMMIILIKLFFLNRVNYGVKMDTCEWLEMRIICVMLHAGQHLLPNFDEKEITKKE